MAGEEQQIARLYAAQSVAQAKQNRGLYEGKGATMSHILWSRDKSLKEENKRRLSSYGFQAT